MHKATSFDDIAIVSIKGNNNRIYFWYMSKNDAINLMKILVLMKKLDCFKSFFIICKR